MKVVPEFKVIEGWEKLPAGYVHKDVNGVAVDSKDNVYLMTRQDARVIVYDRDGNFLRSWGEDIFTPRTHGIAVGPDDMVYTVDDGDHTVRKFTPEGIEVMRIGVPGQTSDTGYDGKSQASVKRSGPPFNRPTDVAVAANGELYVTDGYGNARVHHFSADGTLIRSWGEPGTGPGQFRLPHGIGISPDDRIFMTDRENDRIQIFSREGEFLDMWTHVQRPTDISFDREGRVYVSELWWRVGQESFTNQIRPAGRRAGPGPLRECASALVQRRPGGPGKLRCPAQPVRGLARGPVRGRGHLDIRRVARRRARGRAQLPEVRAPLRQGAER